MVSLDNLIYILGKDSTESNQICINKLCLLVKEKDGNKDYNRTRYRIHSLISTHSILFKVSKKNRDNHQRSKVSCYTLSYKGREYYENIKNIYDPIADMRIMDIRNQVK